MECVMFLDRSTFQPNKVCVWTSAIFAQEMTWNWTEINSENNSGTLFEILWIKMMSDDSF